VGNYGQSVRPLQDNLVSSFLAFQYATHDLGADPVSVLGACTIETYFKPKASDDVSVGYSTVFRIGANAYQLQRAAATNFLSVTGYQNTGYALDPNAWQHVRVEHNAQGQAIEAWVDGVSVWSGTSPLPNDNGETVMNVVSDSAANDEVIVKYAKITLADGTIYAQWDFQNELDSSGNDRHLTLVNNPSFPIDNSAELAPYDRINTEGYSEGTGAYAGYLVPAQVGSTTLDALGNPLEYRGSAYPALPQKVQSVGRGFDGTTQYITMASLTGSETVTSWGGTGTEPTISAGRIDFTAGSYWELTLSTGVSIPFNNSGAYDLASDGTLVEYINNPSVVRQDVYHAEMDRGFYKAVRKASGAAGRIVTDVVDSDVVSIKARFIANSDGAIIGLGSYDPSSHCKLRFSGASALVTIGSISDILNISSLTPFGKEHTVEIFVNGDVWVNEEYQGNTGGVYVPHTTTGYACFLSQVSWFQSSGSDAILLQAWVNGQEIDIHDTNNHVGAIETHRLVDYPELTNPPAGTGHNDADTGLNLTHLTPTGDRTPALTASGQDIQNYQFGDTLVNPAFKRVVSADLEDRHSVFQEPLTGACLGKAQDFFSVPDGFTYSFPIQLS